MSYADSRSRKDPRGVLAAAERLRPGGRIVSLVGGNAASLANRVMRAASAAFDPMRLWYFTPESYGRLLESCGLEQLRTEGLLDEVDTIVNYLRYDDPYSPSFDEEVLPDELLAVLRRAAVSGDRGYKFLSHAVVA